MSVRKKTISLLAAVTLLFGLILPSFALGETVDYQDHWAKEQISRWLENGLINGYPDGTFRPNNEITRAEFLTIVNNALGFYEKADTTYKDVTSKDWFADEIAKAAKVGYVIGYEDGTIKPNNSISRQEAAIILARLLSLKASDNSGDTQINDAADIASWSIGFVNAVTKEGYMSGYPDQTFRAENPITRAETIVMLDNAIGILYNEAGTYGVEADMDVIDDHVTISSSDVILRNTEINGNLYITEGVGEGDVTLDNVVVKGKTLIKGGGENSIIIRNSTLGDTIIDKNNGQVRIVALGDSRFGLVVLNSGAKLEEEDLTGVGFEDVIITEIPEGSIVELNGDFETVDVEAPVSVKVVGGTIEQLNINDDAADAQVNVGQDANIALLTVNSNADVSGEGRIVQAIINSDGVTIEQRPMVTKVSEGIVASVGGQDIVGTPEVPSGDTGVVEAIDPAITSATLIKDGEGNLVLTVEAEGDNLYSLEVDHSHGKHGKWAQAGLPEFTVYASVYDAWGEFDSETHDLSVYGVDAVYDADTQTWTITLNSDGYVMGIINDETISNGAIEFYLVVNNEEGKSSGSMNDGSYEKVVYTPEIDETNPEITSATIVKDGNGNLVLTVVANDDHLYSLEVDHSHGKHGKWYIAPGLPEFKVYASADNPWGDNENPTYNPSDYGVEAAYNAATQTWTITLQNGGDAMNAIDTISDGAIEFYLVAHDESGNSSGSMSDGSYEKVEYIPLKTTSTINKDGDGNLVLTVVAQGNNLYSLEVDHSHGKHGKWDISLPEFSVYASQTKPWGENENPPNDPSEYGVAAAYIAGTQTWTITLQSGGDAMNAINGEPSNGAIEFYLVAHDESGNSSGSMNDGSYEKVVYMPEP